MDPSAAPYPLRLNGKEYKAYPFRDIDHEEFNKWCRREYLDRVKQSSDDPEILKIAINEVVNMHWMGSGRVVVNTVRGIHKMACLMVRGEVPYSDVATAEGLREVSDVFVALHESKQPEGEGGEGTGKN